MRIIPPVFKYTIMEGYVKVLIVLYVITLANVLYMYSNIRGLIIQTTILAGFHGDRYGAELHFSGAYTQGDFHKNAESLHQSTAIPEMASKLRNAEKDDFLLQTTKAKNKEEVESNTAKMGKFATAMKNTFKKVASSPSDIQMSSSEKIAKTRAEPKGNITGDDAVFNRKLLDLYHKQTMKYRRSGICPGLFRNNSHALEQARNYTKAEFKKDFRIDSKQVPMMTRNCEAYRTTRGFLTSPLSKEESEFPLAFSILTYENIEQLERFIRVLYQPQNVYCFHIDDKSSPLFKGAVRSIANCFDNVFVASKLESVVYASYSRLKADINCMSDLLKRKEKWKYLLNFASSELPLKSNKEMVQILKLFRGANDIHEVFAKRVEHRYKYSKFSVINGRIQRVKELMSPPPFNLTITKGQAYNIFSRAFVQFALTSKISRTFLKWCRDTYSPDEHFWATLNNQFHNSFLKTPGGYKGHPDSKPYVTRYINWRTSFYHCYGEYVRNVCVFGYGDLPLLKRKGQFATNKFNIQKDAIVYSCMEDFLENKALNPSKVDAKFWSNLNFVKEAYRPITSV